MSSTGSSDKAARPSEWQQRIEGEWHGVPSVFDAQGNHVGFEYVDRASVVEDGSALTPSAPGSRGSPAACSA